MRVGVGQLKGKPMFVFHAHTHLERVVAEVRPVFLLIDTGVSGELTIQVGIQRSVGDTLTMDEIVQGQGIDLAGIILTPTQRANVLELADDCWCNLSLNSEAKLRRAWRWVVVRDVCQRRRE